MPKNVTEAGSQDKRLGSIQEDMLTYLLSGSFLNALLIVGDKSRDIGFIRTLNRTNFGSVNIFLAQPDGGGGPIVHVGPLHWYWGSLAAGGGPLPSDEKDRLVNEFNWVGF
ncbi:unnamed protein product [Microthlaspi erraticum]|uniref:Uncharacterized protein n=1 Tax=Microthlaspi erraticum TaxID=1685480 RepID=A0A6D2J5E9_9BRAS|nr:unnamed protein product [Microthlaspi erraticum]